MIGALALVVGCHDYGLQSGAEAEGVDPVEAEPPDTASDDLAYAQASFDVVFQRTAFGAQTSRCQVEVAFYRPDEDDALAGTPGQVIAYPEEPGTCAYTAFDDTQAAVEMGVRGTFDAGSALVLGDAAGELSLPRAEDDRVYYALDDCDAESFPFGRVLDLAGPGQLGDDGFPVFALEAAVAVGPDMVRVAPADELLVRDELTWSQQEALVVAWAYTTDPPSVSETPLAASPMVVLRNTEAAENQIFEALACWPAEEGRIELSATDLSLLQPGDGSGDTFVALQVDVAWTGPEVVAPWGEVVRVRSLVTWGGIVQLQP